MTVHHCVLVKTQWIHFSISSRHAFYRSIFAEVDPSSATATRATISGKRKEQADGIEMNRRACWKILANPRFSSTRFGDFWDPSLRCRIDRNVLILDRWTHLQTWDRHYRQYYFSQDNNKVQAVASCWQFQYHQYLNTFRLEFNTQIDHPLSLAVRRLLSRLVLEGIQDRCASVPNLAESVFLRKVRVQNWSLESSPRWYGPNYHKRNQDLEMKVNLI